MARQRINPDRVQTDLENNRRNRDLGASIDDDIDGAMAQIDWDRRHKAEQSLYDWVCTYMVGLMLNDPPPERGKEVLSEMETAMTSHTNTLLCISRGAGKTSFCQCGCLYAICTGKQKYVVIVSANQRSANNLLSDFWKICMESDTAFSQDYPEICVPFQLTRGSVRRRQLYRGVSTDIVKTSEKIAFARLTDDSGNEMPTSGSVIETRGYTGQLRGMKTISGGQSIRPTLALLDDWEDEETASSADSVQKMYDIITKDIIPMGGKQRMSLLCTATPVCQDDLVERLKKDKHWRTVLFPAVISYPTNKKLWDKYFEMYDDELINRKPHSESLQYYKDNRKLMDDGADVFNPSRYSEEDGHISAIQKLLELRHQIGESAWASEYQMRPLQLQIAIPIDPATVASRVSSLKELEIPTENVAWVCASSDLNLSKYITTVIVVFMRDQTAHVIWHKFRKSAIPITLPEQDYYQRVYNLLAEHGKELKALGVRIDGWAIDGNGVPAKAVQDFCRNSVRACGIPAASYIGQASHLYRPYRKSRLKDDVNRTLLCGDDQEHKVSGTGRKWTFFDSDSYHEMAQKALLQAPGNVGSLSWYDGGDHSKWAIQVCAERLICKRSRPDGTTEYTWRDTGDHDALDAIGQALAAYASQGFSSGGTGRQTLRVARQKLKPKIRIV